MPHYVLLHICYQTQYNVSPLFVFSYVFPRRLYTLRTGTVSLAHSTWIPTDEYMRKHKSMTQERQKWNVREAVLCSIVWCEGEVEKASQDKIRAKINLSPDQCGSVGWVSSCKGKGHGFDSRSGSVPGLQARPQLGCVREATHQCFSHTSTFLSSSFSLPSLSLKTNKYLV